MNRTLGILKPDCVKKGLTGKIIEHIEQAGFTILCMKKVWLTRKEAEEFYAVHKERPFYGELVDYMTSGPCIPMVLEKENAVTDFRKVIGATDPKEAEEGTIRKLYAESKSYNVVHGSDSPENAEKEIAFFFSTSDIIKTMG